MSAAVITSVSGALITHNLWRHLDYACVQQVASELWVLAPLDFTFSDLAAAVAMNAWQTLGGERREQRTY